jgi:2-polyprenyl-6-methoxyphenol hydroxylase-like FAD-dependent oxidoreductase
MSYDHTEVLVVGAGPAGLTLAVSLAQAGRDVTIVDAHPAAEHTSRAAVVHARTLEVLAPLGVAEPLIAQGDRVSSFAVRDRDRRLIPVSFDGLPTRYPYTLMVSQAVTEATLADRLGALGGKVLRPLTLTGLTQDGDAVTATFNDGRQLRASYVVGADGMASTVRELVGIGFVGAAYPESFALADIRLAGPALPPGEVTLYFSPAGMMVAAPLPGDVVRIVATVDEAPPVPDVAFVQRLLDTRGPVSTRAVVAEVLWGSRFRVHHRVAQRYRAGRVLLVGDAAHVHSPAGGQGMNTGITDAVVLGEALDAVLGGAPEARLDEYGASRRPVALQVIALADRLTRLATVPRWARPARNLLLRGLATIPAVRRQLALRLSGLVYRAH